MTFRDPYGHIIPSGHIDIGPPSRPKCFPTTRHTTQTLTETTPTRPHHRPRPLRLRGAGLKHCSGSFLVTEVGDGKEVGLFPV